MMYIKLKYIYLSQEIIPDLTVTCWYKIPIVPPLY